MKVSIKKVSRGFGKFFKSQNFKDFLYIEVMMGVGSLIGWKYGRDEGRLDILNEMTDPEKLDEGVDFLKSKRDKKNYPILDNKLLYNKEKEAFELYKNQPEAWPKDEET